MRAARDHNLEVADALDHASEYESARSEHLRSAADRLSAILDYLG